MPVFARGNLKAQSSGTQIRQDGICAIGGDRGRKEGLRSGAGGVCRRPAAYNELIRCSGMKRRLDVAAGFGGRPIRGGRAGATAEIYRRIPLRLTAGTTRRLRPSRATALSGDSHGASEHGHRHPEEAQPDRQNGRQPTHYLFCPQRSSPIDAGSQRKFSWAFRRAQACRGSGHRRFGVPIPTRG